VALEGSQAAIDVYIYIYLKYKFTWIIVFLSFYGKLAWYPTGTFFFLIIFVLFLLIFWRQFAKDKRRSGLFALRPLSFIRSLRPSPQRQRQRQRERERERERETWMREEGVMSITWS